MRISALCLRAAIAAVPFLAGNAARAETVSTTAISSTTSVAAPVSVAESNYELGGFFGAGDKLEVSLKKRGETAAKWVRVGKKTGNLLVESADAQKGFAIVNIAGSRYRLNLRGEKATPLPAVASTGTTTISSSAAIASPPKRTNESPEQKKRREQFEAIMSGLTSEQHRRIGETLSKRMQEMMQKNPELAKSGDPKAMQRLGREAFRDGIRDALQMPGKDGKAGEVPGDFNELFDAGTSGEAPTAGAVVSVSGPIVVSPDDASEPGAGGAPAPGVLVFTSDGGSGNIIVSPNATPAPVPAPASTSTK